MDITSNSSVAGAVAAASNVGGDQQVAVLKKALDSEASVAAGLIDALPKQPPLAQSGSLGTRINTYA